MAKAESLLAQLRKRSDSVRQVSERKFTCKIQVQLKMEGSRFFKRGAMVKAFDETVFKLKQGEMSGLVSTEYGVHIIQLNAIKPAAVKPFDEVRGELAVEIRKQKASKAFAEAAENLLISSNSPITCKQLRTRWGLSWKKLQTRSANQIQLCLLAFQAIIKILEGCIFR